MEERGCWRWRLVVEWVGWMAGNGRWWLLCKDRLEPCNTFVVESIEAVVGDMGMMGIADADSRVDMAVEYIEMDMKGSMEGTEIFC